MMLPHRTQGSSSAGLYLDIAKQIWNMHGAVLNLCPDGRPNFFSANDNQHHVLQVPIPSGNEGH